MSGIKTKYDVTLEIDDTSFDVTVSDPSPEQVEELKAMGEDDQIVSEQLQDLEDELAYKKEMFDINRTILADGSVVDKAKTWFEQKTLAAEIFTLKTKHKALKKERGSLEGLYKRRFELIVSGTAKTALQAYIDRTGLSYIAVNGLITKKIQEAYEKK